MKDREDPAAILAFLLHRLKSLKKTNFVDFFWKLLAQSVTRRSSDDDSCGVCVCVRVCKACETQLISETGSCLLPQAVSVIKTVLN